MFLFLFLTDVTGIRESGDL